MSHNKKYAFRLIILCFFTDTGRGKLNPKLNLLLMLLLMLIDTTVMVWDTVDTMVDTVDTMDALTGK